MTDDQLRAWAATAGDVGAAVLRTLRERGEAWTELQTREREAERHLAKRREAEAEKIAFHHRVASLLANRPAKGAVTPEEKIQALIDMHDEARRELGQARVEQAADRAAVMGLILTLPSCGRCERRATKSAGKGAERWCDAHAPQGCPDSPRAQAIRAIDARFAAPMSATAAAPRGTIAALDGDAKARGPR